MVPLLLSLTAAAAELVVLDASDDPAEERLAEELLLSGLDVRLVAAAPDFLGLPLPAQLDSVRPELAPGVGVGWVTTDDDDLHLSLAFVEADRAVVRVVDVPRGPGAEARLALAAREVLTVVLAAERPPAPAPPPPPPPPPDPAGHTAWQVTALGLAPIDPDGGGPRLGVEGELVRADARDLGAGGRIGVQAGLTHPRVTAAAVGRWRGLTVGAGADLAFLEWTTWVQPRLDLGGDIPLGAWRLGVRGRLAPVRDRIARAGTVLYDSGWVEAGVAIGWRQILPAP